MGMLKIVLSVFVVFFVSISWGQNSNLEHKNEPSRNIRSSKKIVKLNQMYFEKVNILQTYFVKGEIKNGFPGYNYALSKEVNINEIKKWILIGKNKMSLTQEGLEAIELYTKSK